ncbi:hypothetical protein POL25_01000 [Nannocystis sp. bb15-2]|uniref:Lipoprotein n=1 Tax=Nannocystis bainbridge TaxID=2995303 RepID=A0ABT5DP66_9BACT|nr:hypothetical protein [Nannocystis bainbridge]
MAVFGPFVLLAVTGCVDKTPPPLWPTPPPPPMATPIGVPERPVSAAGGQGDAHEDESMKPAASGPTGPVDALAGPEIPLEQPGALGPWQPAPPHR